MSFLTKFKPGQTPYELDASLAPGRFFFCRRIEIPADLEKGEEEGFALLELEKLSPFPLEHMYYGYRLSRTGRHAFVFAAYKRRFEGGDVGSWKKRDFVSPEFIVALALKFDDDPRPLVVVSDDSLSAFGFDTQSDLPCSFYAEARANLGEGMSTTLETEIADMADRVATRISLANARVWKVDSEPNWLGGTAWFEVTDMSDGQSLRLSLQKDELWRADIRDPETIDLAKKNEKQNALLWKGVVAVLSVVGLLIIGELAWLGGSWYLAGRKATNESRLPTIQAIESRQDTVNQLRSFRDSNLDPFTMIEALLPYQEYPKIIYRRFEMSEPDTLVIDGRADNQTEVTRFKQRLDGFDRISSANITYQGANQAGSAFTLTLVFKSGGSL